MGPGGTPPSRLPMWLGTPPPLPPPRARQPWHGRAPTRRRRRAPAWPRSSGGRWRMASVPSTPSSLLLSRCSGRRCGPTVLPGVKGCRPLLGRSRASMTGFRVSMARSVRSPTGSGLEASSRSVLLRPMRHGGILRSRERPGSLVAACWVLKLLLPSLLCICSSSTLPMCARLARLALLWQGVPSAPIYAGFVCPGLEFRDPHARE